MGSLGGECGFGGNADMYGLGIRIGYYIQWYGSILAAWIAPSETQGLRIANALFVTATFLALVILTARAHGPSDLPIVETYIILFLAFGSYLVLIPIYIWRLFTGCNPLWDPTRFPRVNPGRVYSVCNTLLLVAVLVFQIWFWGHQVPKLDKEECKQYGFFFKKFVLNSKPFLALNLLTSICLLVICIVMVGVLVWNLARKNSSWRMNKKYIPLENVPRSRILTLQILDSASQAIVATVIIIGVELTIVWNDIKGVHDISSAGQTIPVFLGIGAVAMVFYVRFFKDETEEVLADAHGNDYKPGQGIGTPGLEMGYMSVVGNETAMATYENSHQNHATVHVAAVTDLPGAARESQFGGNQPWWGGFGGFGYQKA